MFQTFDHYLMYGATDQTTLRELGGQFDGVVVPGTVAAFQKQGTGGFVLTLSVTDEEKKYVIDPRFPLFQQQLAKGKNSHRSLAEVFQDAALVTTDSAPSPSDFSTERLDAISAAWVKFNETYPEEAGKSFSKYEKRLGRKLQRRQGQDVEAILPPYFVSLNGNEEWDDLSEILYDLTLAKTSKVVVPVIAVESVGVLASQVARRAKERAVVWVSGLNEVDAREDELIRYGEIIRQASANETSLFSLYGGFFSVLLGSVGLCGSSHGIGFSESRDWLELPESGPPPARYYLPRAHKYVGKDVAQRIYGLDQTLGGCPCQICNGRPPIVLNYHDLMKHSVTCRSHEVQTWATEAPEQVRAQFADEVDETLDRRNRIARDLGLLGPGTARAFDHLPTWVSAFRSIST